MVPANPGIALNDDEVCLFMSDASIGKEKHIQRDINLLG